MSRIHGLHTAHSIAKGRKIIEVMINKIGQRPQRKFIPLGIQNHYAKRNLKRY